MNEKFIPRGYHENAGYKALLENLNHANSFQEICQRVFGFRNDLSLLDLGSGNGLFTIGMAHMRKKLGLGRIVASDFKLGELNNNRTLLDKSGVETRELDIKTMQPTDERFDIVTMNAPIISGLWKDVVIYDALKKMKDIIARRGILMTHGLILPMKSH